MDNLSSCLFALSFSRNFTTTSVWPFKVNKGFNLKASGPLDLISDAFLYQHHMWPDMMQKNKQTIKTNKQTNTNKLTNKQTQVTPWIENHFFAEISFYFLKKLHGLRILEFGKL